MKNVVSVVLIIGSCLFLTGCEGDGRRCLESVTVYVPQTTYVNKVPITTIIPFESCTKYEEKETS